MDLITFWLVIATVIIFVLYAVLINFYYSGWNALPEFIPKNEFQPTVKVSVLVPARNEAENIGLLLKSLSQQTYPRELTEVIIIDDHSTDKTAEITINFADLPVKLISLEEYLPKAVNSYKKKGIETGVEQSTGDWIITTDADCTAGPDWLNTIMEYRQVTNAELIAGPVKLERKKSLLSVFQSLDFITLQGITGASVHKKFHSMCNGANLAYSKKAFLSVKGFENIDQIASGDDILLMHKIEKAFPGKTLYLKSKPAVVSSMPANNWRAFWNQRIRWASKADKYEERKITWILLLVYIFNGFLCLLFFLSIRKPELLLIALLLLFCKTVIEFPFAKTVAKFFGEEKLMTWFLFLQPLHILYIIIAGVLGKIGYYEWKGRRVK